MKLKKLIKHKKNTQKINTKSAGLSDLARALIKKKKHNGCANPSIWA
jgi:hypothetical protein